MDTDPEVGRTGTRPALQILGTRGVPARHGGFETFVEHLAPYLSARGWDVTVYCQGAGDATRGVAAWRGVRLETIPVSTPGAVGTAVFDLRCTLAALRRPGPLLVLGYNTAVLGALPRLRGRAVITNMDGIEWRRGKWPIPAKAWLYANERLGCWLGSHLIADNPGILSHLATRARGSKITMIPYGADAIRDADPARIAALGVSPRRYAIVVARLEPENSILEIVRAYSRRPRRHRLVVVGGLDPAGNRYHRRVLDAAGPEVLFAGPIYDRDRIAALRFFARLYVHGHQVGGTNPSLVEALGAGNPVLARDNGFNHWVAGPAAAFFTSESDCAQALDTLIDDEAALARMADASRRRHAERFTWERVLDEYAALLLPWAKREL